MGRTGLILFIFLATGCAGPENGVLAWQRNYALSIPDPNARASALGSVAMTASYTGDLGTMKKALDDLKGDPSYDEYAGRCAVELNRAGRPAEARRMAKRITSPEKQKEVLEKLDNLGKPAERTDGGHVEKPVE